MSPLESSRGRLVKGMCLVWRPALRVEERGERAGQASAAYGASVRQGESIGTVGGHGWGGGVGVPLC